MLPGNIAVRANRVILAIILLVNALPCWAGEWRVATFQADITIPIGHACMGGGVSDAKEIADPLLARGLVLLEADKPPAIKASGAREADCSRRAGLVPVQQRFVRRLARGPGRRRRHHARPGDAGHGPSARLRRSAIWRPSNCSMGRD